MTDEDLAAALLLATRSGLLTPDQAVALVDAEIATRPTPAAWLLDASMARSPQDVLHVLAGQADGHPLLSDTLALFESLELAVSAERIDVDQAVAVVVALYPYPQLPSDLLALVYALDEEATCAHEHDGVPQPTYVAKALSDLLGVARGRSKWRPVLEHVIRRVE